MGLECVCVCCRRRQARRRRASRPGRVRVSSHRPAPANSIRAGYSRDMIGYRRSGSLAPQRERAAPGSCRCTPHTLSHTHTHTHTCSRPSTNYAPCTMYTSHTRDHTCTHTHTRTHSMVRDNRRAPPASPGWPPVDWMRRLTAAAPLLIARQPARASRCTQAALAAHRPPASAVALIGRGCSSAGRRAGRLEEEASIPASWRMRAASKSRAASLHVPSPLSPDPDARPGRHCCCCCCCLATCPSRLTADLQDPFFTNCTAAHPAHTPTVVTVTVTLLPRPPDYTTTTSTSTATTTVTTTTTTTAASASHPLTSASRSCTSPELPLHLHYPLHTTLHHRHPPYFHALAPVPP